MLKYRNIVLGFAAGAIYFLWKIVLYFTHLQHEVLPSFPIAPLLGLMGIAIIYVILKMPSENFNIIDGFKEGGRVGLMCALTASLGILLYYSVIDPNFFEIQIAHSQDLLVANGGVKLTDQQLEPIRKLQKPLNWSALTLSGVSFAGMAVSMIFSGLYKVFISK